MALMPAPAPAVRPRAARGVGCVTRCPYQLAVADPRSRRSRLPSSLGLYSSRRGKFVVWARLLDDLHLVGDEQVLDVGCGRGAILVLAARRFTTGRAVGVDLWRKSDQSGNDRNVTERNAVLEGVADRVQLETADMVDLPFGDEPSDVVSPTWQCTTSSPHRDEIRRSTRPSGCCALVAICWLPTSSVSDRIASAWPMPAWTKSPVAVLGGACGSVDRGCVPGLVTPAQPAERCWPVEPRSVSSWDFSMDRTASTSGEDAGWIPRARVGLSGVARVSSGCLAIWVGFSRKVESRTVMVTSLVARARCQVGPTQRPVLQRDPGLDV